MRDINKTKRKTIASIFNNILIGVIAGLLASLITFIITSILHLPDKVALQIVIALALVVGVLISWLAKKIPLLLSKVAVFLLFSFGVLLILSAYRLEMWADIAWDIRIVGLGTGLIGISIGFLALYVSRRSDERMQAMANLEFYEKVAVMEAYISEILRSDVRKRSSAEEEERIKGVLKANAERIYHDIKGAKQLKKHVDPDVSEKLNREIDELKNIASEHKEQYKELIEKLDQLKQEDPA